MIRILGSLLVCVGLSSMVLLASCAPPPPPTVEGCEGAKLYRESP